MVNKNSVKTGSMPPGFVMPPFPPPASTPQAQGGGGVQVQMVQGMVQGQVEPATEAQAQVYNNRARAFLAAQRFPSGLHEAFFLTCQRAPLHYFICDNSGSMAIDDCNRLVGGINPRNAKMLKCSRWTELCEMMRFHGQLAEAAHTPVEFRFLNDFAPIRVGDGGPGFSMLEQALRSRPTGGTPLCRHIAEITAQVRANEQWLRANNQLACIVIATDGEASDGDIVTSLRPLAALPAWVIVRLCTEDEAIDRYWQGVDATLVEMKIDIIEDFLIEAREVHRFNPWLTYGEPLHRMREWGLTFKEMDLAQQRRLGMEEVRFAFPFQHCTQHTTHYTQIYMCKPPHYTPTHA